MKNLKTIPLIMLIICLIFGNISLTALALSNDTQGKAAEQKGQNAEEQNTLLNTAEQQVQNILEKTVEQQGQNPEKKTAGQEEQSTSAAEKEIEGAAVNAAEDTGEPSPKVTATIPENGQSGVNPEDKIIIRYSEKIVPPPELDKITITDRAGNKLEDYSLSFPSSSSAKDSFTIAPEGLLANTEYTISLPEGTVLSELKIKSEAYSFSFTTGSGNEKQSARFIDVPKNHWAYDAVTAMADKGIITGYSDGRFRPDDTVSREQFAEMMVLALNIPVEIPDSPTFKDVDRNYGAYKYIESAKNYLTGYKKSDGLYYRGSRSAVREDMAYALVRAKGYQNEKVDISKLSGIFKDVGSITKSLEKYILIAYEKGIMSGYNDKTFKPQGELTRAEAAQLLYNASLENEKE